MADLEAEAAAAAAAAAEGGEGVGEGGADKKKKGGKASKKKGKKKAGKLEPGMAEAQTFASAVLRLISLGEEWRAPLVRAPCPQSFPPSFATAHKDEGVHLALPRHIRMKGSTLPCHGT